MSNRAKISLRLQKIAEMVRHPSVVDVGTDHAMLPVFLAQQNVANKILATDVNAGPLASASANIAAYGMSDAIRTKLCDGLDGVTPGEYDTCIIAGMGGRLIIRILEQNIETMRCFKQLIVSPQRHAEEVRRFLHTSGFYISDEVMMEESGKFYNILDCSPGHEPPYDDLGYLFGRILMQRKDEVLKKYALEEEQRTKAINRPELNKYLQYCAEVLKCLSKCVEL
ncbi:MAG: class I SAM-dependent methyltransferase [Defluviitaleaceae bacterium]|nr:class I SAM-dependent methyltransferase [Defluviitaleaceae bacterium]